MRLNVLFPTPVYGQGRAAASAASVVTIAIVATKL